MWNFVSKLFNDTQDVRTNLAVLSDELNALQEEIKEQFEDQETETGTSDLNDAFTRLKRLIKTIDDQIYDIQAFVDNFDRAQKQRL